MVVPIELDDPLERVQAVHDAAVNAKETHHLLGPELVSRWSAYFPPAPAEWLFRWLASKDGQNKVLNIPISNVPGPREPGRVGGALVTEIYSVGPLTTGSGLNITVWSYVDQLNISVLSDGATLVDPHELTDAMIDAFVEIRAGRRPFRGADGRREGYGGVVGERVLLPGRESLARFSRCLPGTLVAAEVLSLCAAQERGDLLGGQLASCDFAGDRRSGRPVSDTTAAPYRRAHLSQPSGRPWKSRYRTHPIRARAELPALCSDPPDPKGERSDPRPRWPASVHLG